jgi:hypothetical protein
MAIEHIHTFMVHPRKGADASNIGGAEVLLEGKLFNLLNDVYQKSDSECDIDISFNQSAQGGQQNTARDFVLAYLAEPSLDTGRAIAQRLEAYTTHRSGLGLLFLIGGKDGTDHKVVISRFPADSAILAQENQQELSVEFLERVFMKSAHSYKAAAYRGASLRAGFWTGRVIDKQISNPAVQASNYWIAQFLDSDFRTTSAAGTRRLAVVLRDAARNSDDLSVKREIAAAVTLAGGLAGKPLSIQGFQDYFHLSDGARQAMGREIRAHESTTEQFMFDATEFSNHVAFRSVELDSGAVLTAPSNRFDDVFEQAAAGDEVRFSATGRIVGERLTKIK